MDGRPRCQPALSLTTLPLFQRSFPTTDGLGLGPAASSPLASLSLAGVAWRCRCCGASSDTARSGPAHPGYFVGYVLVCHATGPDGLKSHHVLGACPGWGRPSSAQGLQYRWNATPCRPAGRIRARGSSFTVRGVCLGNLANWFLSGIDKVARRSARRAKPISATTSPCWNLMLTPGDPAFSVIQHRGVLRSPRRPTTVAVATAAWPTQPQLAVFGSVLRAVCLCAPTVGAGDLRGQVAPEAAATSCRPSRCAPGSGLAVPPTPC